MTHTDIKDSWRSARRESTATNRAGVRPPPHRPREGTKHHDHQYPFACLRARALSLSPCSQGCTLYPHTLMLVFKYCACTYSDDLYIPSILLKASAITTFRRPLLPEENCGRLKRRISPPSLAVLSSSRKIRVALIQTCSKWQT